MWDHKMKTKSSSFNHVAVKIGSRDFTTGLFQTVEFAFNMYAANKFSNAEKPDIALVIVKTPIKRLSKDYPELQVGPICLPNGYASLFNYTTFLLFFHFNVLLASHKYA